MGWWNAGPDGTSLHTGPTGLVWGDEPADIVDGAIDEIVDAFRKDWNRNPTMKEMLSGFRFSLGWDSEIEWQQFLQKHNPHKFQGKAHAVTMQGELLNAIPKPTKND